jgi:hypothetical protein
VPIPRDPTWNPRLRLAVEEIDRSLSGKAEAPVVEAIDARVTALENTITTPTPAIVPDSVPRWVEWTVPFTVFNGDPGAVIPFTLDSLPAGSVWTHFWILPTVNFTGGPIGGASATVLVPTNGHDFSGGIKSVDVFTPDPLANQTAEDYLVSDPAAAQDLVFQLTLTGGVGTDLTAGECRLRLLMSIPGGTGKLLAGLGD